jgi:hypothetical protein
MKVNVGHISLIYQENNPAEKNKRTQKEMKTYHKHSFFPVNQY